MLLSAAGFLISCVTELEAPSHVVSRPRTLHSAGESTTKCARHGAIRLHAPSQISTQRRRALAVPVLGPPRERMCSHDIRALSASYIGHDQRLHVRRYNRGRS